ncbi:hypothetical protein AB835_08085 [Candidatus Endobugula sertula]|uniref:Type 4b pilus protein PilO2 n=1 Tax=Candidatus Endobugula sertula TaxID=62101 RepID=A0A1D2QPS3_9GAMM|nr:hypothetical protein AB835_08085 [Candidatus Endobugula sertula]
MAKSRQFKNAQFIRIEGQLWALGLEWHQVKGKEASVRHCRQLAKDSRGTYGTLCYAPEPDRDDEDVETTNDVNTPLPLFGVVANAGRGRRARSAAVLVDQTYEQAIVVLPIEDGVYWLCAVAGGMVIIGKDVVSDEDEIRTMATELLSLNPDFTCVGDDTFWDEVDWSSLDRDPATVDVIDVDTFFDPQDSSDVPALIHYGSRRWLWASLAMISACVVGIAAHQAYQQWLAPEPVAAQVEQDPAEIAMDTHNATVTRVVQESGIHRSNVAWTQRVLALVDRTPVNTRGWTLQRVECGFMSDQCELQWSSAIGTYADLLQARGSQSQMTFDGPKQATEVLPLSVKDRLLSSLRDQGAVRQYVTTLPNTRHFDVQHVSQLQEFDSLDDVSRFGLNTQPAQSYLSLAPVPTRQTVGSLVVGDWHLDGTGITILLGSIQLLNPSVFHVQSLALTLKKTTSNQSSLSRTELSVEWKLTGNYTTQGDQ